MPHAVAPALAENRKRRQPSVVPYVMVDRRRLRRLPPTVGALRRGGATAVELGFPFSDPIADGPVLQAAADRALRNGTRWEDLLFAAQVTSQELPVAVMTYANPVLAHGLLPALGQLHDVGVTGLIVPDLSWEESGPWRRAARANDISLVMLAAPGASTARVQQLAKASEGFLYMVGRYGTTGRSTAASPVDVSTIMATAHRIRPLLPVLIGFGIRTPDDVRRAVATGSDGVVVGTALEERLAENASTEAIFRFIRGLDRAVSTE